MVCPLCVEDVYEASWEPRAPPLGSEEEDDPELAGIEDERVRGLYRSTRDHLRHSHEAQQREDNAPAEEGDSPNRPIDGRRSGAASFHRSSPGTVDAQSGTNLEEAIASERHCIGGDTGATTDCTATAAIPVVTTGARRAAIPLGALATPVGAVRSGGHGLGVGSVYLS
eukprot:ctg_1042.g382